MALATANPLAPLDCHRTRLSPESQARVVHLLFVDGLSVQIVARRFGVGLTTIRRIQMAHCEKIDSRKLRADDR
jgi:transposase-like protein